jgi:hypothetical protein
VTQHSGAIVDLQILARALGGEVRNKQVLAPGPGHSAADRSQCIRLDQNAPDGFLVHSFARDDPLNCRDYVRKKAGLPAWKANGNGHQQYSVADIERAVRIAALAQSGEIPQSGIIATYNYFDKDGTLLYQVLRYEPKRFGARRPNHNGGWIRDAGERRVLYQWKELLAFPYATVFVTEGEKDCDRVRSLGHCATTVAFGKWTNDCVEALSGRDCLILEDNDDAGRAKALAAAQALHGTVKTIRIVRLPDLPDKGDVSDWLDAHPRRAEKLVDICFDQYLWAPDTTKDNKQTSTPTAGTPSKSGEIILRCAANVEAQPIDWIWDGRIARGNSR